MTNIRSVIGGTSLYRADSSWCCLQPKKYRRKKEDFGRQRCYRHSTFLHRQPASHQGGGRGCGPSLVVGGGGRCRSGRGGEGTTQHFSGSPSSQPTRQPPLALVQIFKVDIIIIGNKMQKMINLLAALPLWEPLAAPQVGICLCHRLSWWRPHLMGCR